MKLPSDEEITFKAIERWSLADPRMGFLDGAQWYRDLLAPEIKKLERDLEMAVVLYRGAVEKGIELEAKVKELEVQLDAHIEELSEIRYGDNPRIP